MIRIGNINSPSRVFLAPIAGYTDVAFRLVVRRAGHVGFAYTELLNARGILQQKESSLDIARTDAGDQPLGVQLYGNDPEWFCDAARWAQDHGAQIIDINMGCPVDKITKKNGGSMLLCDPARTTAMAQRIVNAVSIPVTAKLRLGWDDSQLTAPALARSLEQVGIRLITIHGRTTAMRFKGTARLDGIRSVVEAVESIPVIGNGDIQTPDDAKRMMELTGCAGVMVARAAIKRPWLLRDVHALLETGVVPLEPTVLEKLSLIRQHFDLTRRYKDDRSALVMMRGRIAGYGTTLGHVKPFKERIRLMKAVDEFYSALDDLAAAVDPAWRQVPWGTFVEVPG